MQSEKEEFDNIIFRDKEVHDLCRILKLRVNSKKAEEKEKNKPRENSFISCANCQSKLLDINVKQMRSGDEGSTMIIKCLICKQTWYKN